MKSSLLWKLLAKLSLPPNRGEFLIPGMTYKYPMDEIEKVSEVPSTMCPTHCQVLKSCPLSPETQQGNKHIAQKGRKTLNESVKLLCIIVPVVY